MTIKKLLFATILCSTFQTYSNPKLINYLVRFCPGLSKPEAMEIVLPYEDTFAYISMLAPKNENVRELLIEKTVAAIEHEAQELVNKKYKEVCYSLAESLQRMFPHLSQRTIINTMIQVKAQKLASPKELHDKTVNELSKIKLDVWALD